VFGDGSVRNIPFIPMAGEPPAAGTTALIFAGYLNPRNTYTLGTLE